MDAALTAAGAAVAVAVELLEALAIVLAVGVSRRWSDAIAGAGGAVIVCAALAALVGPVLLASVPLESLRLVVGVLLMLFGLEWLRKGTLRIAGQRARSSSAAEYEETRADLEDVPLPPPGQTDWAGRTIAFKGVLLEGVEIVLIVSALAARRSTRSAVIAGAVGALVLVTALGAWLRHPLSRIPETELKWGVGVLLSSFGVFFAGEGLHVHWPGGDAAVLYTAVSLAAASQLLARTAATRPEVAA